jgi:glycosyltransferase involved in cell wall biosynthesis
LDSRALPWREQAREHAAWAAARAGAVDALLYLEAERTLGFGVDRRASSPRALRVFAQFDAPPDDLDARLDRVRMTGLDAVLTCSAEQTDWFRGWLDPARVHPVPQGIDTERFSPAPEGAPAQPPWRVVIPAARYFDLPAALAIAHRLGDDPEVQIHLLQRTPDNLVPPANVRVHGQLRSPERAALLRKSHLLLLPVRRLAACSTALEGMACGLPVVGPDLYALREHAPDPSQRFLPGDSDAAAGRVLALTRDADLRRRLASTARTLAEAQSWTAATAALERVLLGTRD